MGLNPILEKLKRENAKIKTIEIVKPVKSRRLWNPEALRASKHFKLQNNNLFRLLLAKRSMLFKRFALPALPRPEPLTLERFKRF